MTAKIWRLEISNLYYDRFVHDASFSRIFIPSDGIDETYSIYRRMCDSVAKNNNDATNAWQ